MVQPISFEEFAGGGSSVQDGASSSAPDKSRDSSTGNLSYAEFTGRPEGEPEGTSVIRSGLEKLKQAGGEAAAIADFVLSMPGFTLATGAELGGTVQAAASGVPVSPTLGQLNPVTAFTVGRQHAAYYSEHLTNPVQKLMNFMGEHEVYDKSLTNKGMSKFAELVEGAGAWAEQATGGKISRDAIPMLVDTLMVGAIGRAGKGGRESSMTAAQKVHFEELRDQARRQLEQKQQDAAGGTPLTPEEFVARLPVQDQINQTLGIKTEAQRAAELKQRKRAMQQASRGEGVPSPQEQAELDVRGTRTYDNLDQSQFAADERSSNEAEWRKHQNEQMAGEEAPSADTEAPQSQKIGQAEVLSILHKPGFERTAEDLITLRKARESGNASMDATVLLGAAGIGAAAGAELDDDKLRGAMLGGSAMAGVAALIGRSARAGGVESRFKQAGAVKGPGGMWHPEAVERLAAPLADKLQGIGGEGVLASREGNTLARSTADRLVRQYLNKYAGTERDPLKDVRIPHEHGELRWEDAWDKAIWQEQAQHIGKARHIWEVPEEEWLKQAKPEEKISGLNIGDSVRPLSSYLSHVGDYLRQNVKPEELQRYDLVRAVRETAAKDEQMKKQMEKAAAASTKDLPVYKEYPDGMKWVELKEPKELTSDQAKTIRKMTSEERKTESERDYDAGGLDIPEDAYVATDHQGKPIRNNYTGEIAGAGDPETAYLAGQLAQEGNQMGHCVGGYCEGVASGESRIFSLRDKSGKSHVTIETEPGTKGNRASRVVGESLGRKLGELAGVPDNVIQIKGKQNRAPNAEYLPYVQDFVKSGKWGEVNDLHNAFPDGLVKHEGKYLTLEEADRLGLPPARDGRLRQGRQEGFIDQKLVVGLSAIGLGALAGSLLASDDKAGAAILGAFAGSLVMLPGAKERFKAAVNGIDYGLGALSTRIGNISPALKQRGREYEMRVLTEAHRYLHQVAPFMKELEHLPKNQKAELSRAILTNDREQVGYLMKGNMPLVDAWRQVRNTLNELGDKLQGHGRFKTMLQDYFPRLVKDVEGLKAALGVPERTHLEQVLLKAEADSARVRGSPLSNVEISSIINREVQGFTRAKGYAPGFAKARGVDTITETLQPFYHTPAESLFAYIRGATQDLELAKFFGKDLAQTKVGGQQHINVATSVGNIVGRELKDGKITPKQAEELISMLQSRFEGGERASSRLVQEFRNVGNIGLLGNIVSAATQLQDTATAVYMQGLRPALTATARVLSGRERINTADFGLADHIAEEFIGGRGGVSRTKLSQGAMIGGGAVVGTLAGAYLSNGDPLGMATGAVGGAFIGLTGAVGTANALNKIFKQSGFTAIDRFGKNVALEAALIRYTRLSQSPNGVKEIAKKYKAAYGDEFPALVQDLKDGTISERVRAMLFGELSDTQPISKLEMPQAYLDNPNGRLLYMLKTFMLKQMDLARRDVYNEINQGNVGTGLKNATNYALVLGISGAGTSLIQDWLLGRPVHFEAGDVLENVLKTFGWASFVRDKAKKGRIAEAILASAAPPYKIMDDIIARDPRAVSYIPIIGKLYYSWELGGRERAEIAQYKTDKNKGIESELSDRAKDYRAAQREKAKDRKEAR